jgi:hypothetical protein
MRLFEQQARARGFPKVMLNLFGGHERGRALYHSLGFAKVSVPMGKPL